MRLLVNLALAGILLSSGLVLWTPEAQACHEEVTGCAAVCAFVKTGCHFGTMNGASVKGGATGDDEEHLSIADGPRAGHAWFIIEWLPNATKTDMPLHIEVEDDVEIDWDDQVADVVLGANETREVVAFDFVATDENDDDNAVITFEVVSFPNQQNSASIQGTIDFEVHDDDSTPTGSGGSWGNLGTTWGFVIGLVSGIVVAVVATNMMRPRQQRLPSTWT